MAKSYDPKKVSPIVGGRYITGFMDGTFISVEKNEDNVVPHVGSDGEVTFTEKNDNTGTITFTLKQNSTSLAHLRSLAVAKKTFATSIIDGNKDNGGVKSGGNQCRILKTPSLEYADELSGVEVQIYVADLRIG